MLPDFPRLKAERFRWLQRAAYKRSLGKHPILPQMRFFKQHEGDQAQLFDVDGNEAMSGYEKFESRMEIQASELPGLDNEHWLRKLEKMTDDFAASQMKLLLKRVEEAATSAGNVIAAEGGELTEDLIFKVFEKIDFDFEGDRVAPGFAFVAAPGMAERLASLKETEEYKRKHEQLIEQKRVSFRLRQAARKLVD
jgi:hypothetical protein